MSYREYLGDGLYGDFDGYQYVLAANNGIHDTDVVYLEPEVLKKFLKYVEFIEQLKKDHQEKRNKENG